MGMNGVQDFVILGHDGGVSVTTVGGTPWHSKNGVGLQTNMFYGIGVSEVDNVYIGGTQDNDNFIFDNGNWSQPVLEQDGSDGLCHRTNANIAYCQTWCCSEAAKRLYVYTRSNGSWTRFSTDYKPNSLSDRIRQMVISDNGELYICHENIYKSNTPESAPYLDWSVLSDFSGNYQSIIPSARVRSFSVCDRDINHMYAIFSGADWGGNSAQGYLFRTTMGGGTTAGSWEDITANLPADVYNWIPMTNVLVDPNNAARLWITLSGYHTNGSAPPFNGRLRVIMSEDGGDTWNDYSEGLSPFLVTDIVYQKGSNSGLYISTDVGVFYRDASMNQWECYNSGMPVCIVSDLEIDHCRGKLVAATFGRGIWETDLMETAPAEELVEWNSTITTSRDIGHTIRVMPGATLTITATLYMYSDARIIVEPNAKLIIDGGKLTARCDGFWRGIEVVGTSNQHQFPLLNPTHQGLLLMENGAIIEHAREAVQLWNGDWDHIGGVVRTNNAEFRNCRRSVGFLAYQNFSPSTGDPYRNFSSFSKTRFVVDDDYRGGDDFFSHVSMWKVDGVKFTSCTFENLQTNVTASNKLGTGINSIDAHYIVDAYCTTSPPWVGDVCPGYVPTVFRGLGTGIDARSSITAQGFVVDHAYFENNICGVYTNSVNGFSVKNSEFVIGDRPNVDLSGSPHDQFQDRHRGIFGTESSKITIDDNVLSKASGGTAVTEGIVVGYTRDNPEVIFRNEIHDLEYAYVGEGISADVFNFNSHIKGLWFLCNENFGNSQNFFSRKVTNDQVNDPNAHTIRTNQGVAARPADNTFDQQFGSGAGDFKVTTNFNITYWHRNSGNYVPIYYTSGLLNPEPATTIPTNNCASKTLPIIDNPNVVKSYLQTQKTSYGNTRYLYEQLIDGGNTDEVVLEIQESWPQDAWELRDQLLARSPYLSDTVLREVVRRDIMPEAMLTEILVANPDGTRSNGFLQWLQERSGHPLPDNLLGMVVASWDSFTYRSALENQMSLHHGEMSAAASMLVDHYNADSSGVRTDSLRWVWQQVRTPGARYAEALTFMEQGHMDSAYMVITGINVEHQLRTPEAEERERMLALIAFWDEHFSGSNNEQQLDGGQIQALASIIGEAYDRPSSLISNLLCVMYGDCRPPFTGGDEAGEPKSLPYTPIPSTWEHLAPTMSLKPNPAHTWVAIDYRMVLPAEDVFLLVQDSHGRTVHSERLPQKEGQVVWDTRAVSQGTYMVIIRHGKYHVKSEQLIIQR